VEFGPQNRGGPVSQLGATCRRGWPHHLNRTLLILDEPTSALAERATKALFTYLRTLRQRNITSILVTHDMFDAYRVCDRFVIFARGEKVF
jgi:simple sugar transport system ATP-binding protein